MPRSSADGRMDFEDILDPFSPDKSYSQFSHGRQKPEELGSKWELEYNDILEELELKMRGCMLDRDGSLKQLKKPMMNDQGILWIVGYLHGIINKNLYMSVYTIDEIYIMVRDHVLDVITHLFMNHIKYNLSIADYRPLNDLCEAAVLAAYMRTKLVPQSGLSVTMEYRKTIIQHRLLEQQSQMERKKDSGLRRFMSGIFGRNQGGDYNG